ncbi:SDR family NAD(P)-dependent oxidoreductase [Devosia sp.]|uniref:SDR family NAD(P)-dependent oxidoreductase n=1 Tax=Devosia sp. TaxID=1871048 RepID=UPI0035B2A107
MIHSTRFDLTGQLALVTGASRGIGAALARGLAEAGADVVLAARGRAALEDAAAEIRAIGRLATVLDLDVGDSTAIDALFAELAGRRLFPTILINNAGTEQVAPSLEVTGPLWDRIVGTNLKGAFFVAQGFVRQLAGRSGCIVNLCSLSSEVGIPTAVPYTASKSGLAGMTRALAAEWAPLGVRVNGLGPGYFETDMTAGFYADAGWRSAMLAKLPMQRFGELDDLVGAAVFLCAPASAYVTGQVLYVDGGYLASI